MPRVRSKHARTPRIFLMGTKSKVRMVFCLLEVSETRSSRSALLPGLDPGILSRLPPQAFLFPGDGFSTSPPPPTFSTDLGFHNVCRPPPQRISEFLGFTCHHAGRNVSPQILRYNIAVALHMNVLTLSPVSCCYHSVPLCCRGKNCQFSDSNLSRNIFVFKLCENQLDGVVFF